MRKFISLTAATLLLAGSLAGCSAPAKSSAAGISVPVACKSLTTGTNVQQVAVKSHSNGVPTATFPLPLKVGVSQRKIVHQGTGTLFGGNQMVSFDFAGYDARTGKLFQTTKFNGTDSIAQVIKVPTASAASIFCSVFSGAREGATVTAVLNAQDSHGKQAVASVGIKANDPLIFVMKLRKVDLPRAIGTTEPAQAGFPQVVLSSTGVPGLVMQDWDTSAAPTTFTKETLIKGAGEVVKAGQTVTVHYSGFLWSPAKTKFDSSWDSGSPATFQLSQGSVIPGFISAIQGETVGSQVVAVLPPSVAYGDQATGSIPANSTLIFVIDILGVGK